MPEVRGWSSGSHPLRVRPAFAFPARGLALGCSLAPPRLEHCRRRGGACRACLLRAVLGRPDVLGRGLAVVPCDALFR
eukprot:9842249-Alexandrium_andersonii.AAC.1